MSLNESIIEKAALEWFLLRQPPSLYQLRRSRGFGGQVGDQPSRRLRPTRLGYVVGHGAAFAGLRRAKPPFAPGEPAAERELEWVVVQRTNIQR